MTSISTILLVSIFLQFCTVILAFRLIKTSGLQLAWLLIAVGLLLMGIRRAISFYEINQSGIVPTSYAPELLALAVVFVMLIGVALMNPFFSSRQKALMRQRDLAEMVDNSLNEIYIFEVDLLCFIDVNRAARENLGYTMDELASMTPVDIKSEFTRDEFLLLIEPLNLGKENRVIFETKHQRKNSTSYSVEVHLQMSNFSGMDVYSAYILDISERKKTEESMEVANLIYQSGKEAIMVMDERDHIIDINPAFTRITGYGLEEVVGKDPRDMNFANYDEVFYRNMKWAIESIGYWEGEVWGRRKSGEVFAKWTKISVLRDGGGEVYRYVMQFFDITEAKKKDDLIWSQANYDVLTGLPNRRLLLDRLEQEIKKASRNQCQLALMFIDLDHFKAINDTMGHAKGDLLLKEAARRIELCVRESDTVARLGGDEFTAILPNCSDNEQVGIIAQRIVDELSNPFYFDNDENGYYISASIGITLYPDDSEDIEELFKHADQAMYHAKDIGRHGYRFFTESMQLEASDKMAITHDLRQALARGELSVHYQPIIDMTTGLIVKSEALLRWNHPQRGMIEPIIFIPLAEELGLIHEIGEWVFYEAITSIDRWRTLTGRVVPVSVNKSPVQFEFSSQDATWPDKLLSLGLPGSSVTVEITEGLLLKDSPVTQQRLLDFRNNGIEVSIDDFGTGFSSLSYLKRFNIDYLKIDRSFISKLTEDTNDRVLTEAIIVMAHKLGIETIAEGVETVEQRDILMDFGCDYAQGFLYSKAVPVAEFEKMLVVEH